MKDNLYTVKIMNAFGSPIETTRLRINSALVPGRVVTAYRDKPSRPRLFLRINLVEDGIVYATKRKRME